ncbi:hypothetical protein F3J19_15965 [Burkholderia sp. Ax-1724]|nr:hypothetical protein [Burkholderia sp. Ax-1724]
MNPQNPLANFPNLILTNVLGIIEQHWLFALFVVALVIAKTYFDLKTAARRGRNKRNRQNR